MMLRKWLILFLTTLFILSACHSQVYNQAESNVADIKLKTAELRHKADNYGKPPPPLLVKHGMYVDTSPISLKRDPSWLKNNIVIRGDSLPFSYYSRTVGNGAGSNVLTTYQTGLDPSINISLNYTGTIKGALDLISAKTGYVYHINNNNIYWLAFLTKTFDIAFMPGSSDYMLGNSTGSGSSASTGQAGGLGSSAQVSNYVSSDLSESEFSSLKGTLSIWKDLETTISQLLSPQGKVVVSESTTSVTVRDKPTNVELIGQFINNLNHNLSKQVLIKVQVLDVILQNSYTFGIDWQIIVRAFHNSNFVVNANYGQPTTISALSPQPIAGQKSPQMGTLFDPTKAGQVPAYSILFNALNQQGKTSIVTEPRVVCLNNQVAVIRITKSEGYVASVQNTTLTGSSTATTNIGTVTSQITPGTVITGLTLYILPKILKDKIYMQVNADLSTNDGFSTFGPNGVNVPNSTSIQMPNVTAKHFNQRSVIRSGDTLIMSGFRQVQNVANANQFWTSQALGGKGSDEQNKETIVLITPILLNGRS